MREWFAQLVTYSMTTAMSHHCIDYFTLGQEVLRMLADIHEVHITDDDIHRIREAMLTIPAHPDVAKCTDDAARQRLPVRHANELTAQPARPEPQSSTPG